MKKVAILFGLICSVTAQCQELYIFSEPASNMPARSLSIKQTAKILHNDVDNRTESRHGTELMLGVNKNLMLHAALTFSDMYSDRLRWESIKIYAKYRFLTSDDVHAHFRMAVFAEASHSRNGIGYEEIGLDGDQGGIQAGLIATQLLHKFALSATGSFTEVLEQDRADKSFPQLMPYEAFNYSLSAGYLLLPRQYTDYRQTNVNLYAELIGQRTTDLKRYFVDLAPAIQLIFNSEAKLNVGYRFQLGSDMKRMSDKSWLIGFEWLFLNVLKKRS